MFTPKFLSVSLRVFLIASRRASGFGCVNAVRIPRPPAFETAAASSGTPTLHEVEWDGRGSARVICQRVDCGEGDG